jgi:hypothetical protein
VGYPSVDAEAQRSTPGVARCRLRAARPGAPRRSRRDADRSRVRRIGGGGGSPGTPLRRCPERRHRAVVRCGVNLVRRRHEREAHTMRLGESRQEHRRADYRDRGFEGGPAHQPGAFDVRARTRCSLGRDRRRPRRRRQQLRRSGAHVARVVERVFRRWTHGRDLHAGASPRSRGAGRRRSRPWRALPG